MLLFVDLLPTRYWIIMRRVTLLPVDKKESNSLQMAHLVCTDGQSITWIRPKVQALPRYAVTGAALPPRCAAPSCTIFLPRRIQFRCIPAPLTLGTLQPAAACEFVPHPPPPHCSGGHSYSYAPLTACCSP